jgi:uncharacterized protein (DUF1330 family)
LRREQRWSDGIEVADLKTIFSQGDFPHEDGMAAYIISDVTIHDEANAKDYRERAARSIAQHGGKYLARAGAVEALEGCWSPRAIIIVEFPDMDRARAWYRSAEYAEALQYRDATLSRDLILVEGVETPA